jgi:deoxyhypusine monooxygenase
VKILTSSGILTFYLVLKREILNSFPGSRFGMLGQATLLPAEQYATILHNPQEPLPSRFRALFALRNINSDEAVAAISTAFSLTSSALLKHELAYCLGQMRLPSALVCLERVLGDIHEDPMVRHEAGEALGAIGLESSLEVLRKHLNDPEEAVKETCEIAVDNILNKSGAVCPCFHPLDIRFDSVDPAPALTERLAVDELEKTLLDRNFPLYRRYQAMFSLRNRANSEAILALCKGLEDRSSLFRHEVAYVLGQLQSPLAVDALTARLSLPEEAPMVRHECAEALGSIADDRCLPILKQYLDDPMQVVRESCQVALDMWEFERNSDLQ